MCDLVILLLPISLARAGFVLLLQSLLSSNTNWWCSFVRESGHRIYASDRFVAGLCAFLIRPAHLVRSIVVLKPSTLLHFHQALKNRKYRLLFSQTGRRKSGPKGPSQELIDAFIQMKRRNPTWGCPRIAQQIALAFGVEVDKDVVSRILALHFRPVRESRGPSWLTFLGHMKDSLWSVDLFRVQVRDTESALGLVVMDSTRA